MNTTGRNYEAFENLAKELGATFSTGIENLSKEQLSFLREFSRNLNDIGGLGLNLDDTDDFHYLAEHHDLSVDSSDIELFLTVELSRAWSIHKLTKKVLASDTAFRERITERAIDRVLVGLRFTRISEPDAKMLRVVSARAASNILDELNLLSII